MKLRDHITTTTAIEGIMICCGGCCGSAVYYIVWWTQVHGLFGCRNPTNSWLGHFRSPSLACGDKISRRLHVHTLWYDIERVVARRFIVWFGELKDVLYLDAESPQSLDLVTSDGHLWLVAITFRIDFNSMLLKWTPMNMRDPVIKGGIRTCCEECFGLETFCYFSDLKYSSTWEKTKVRTL